MAIKPWVTFQPTEPGGEYLALLTELPLRRWRDLPRFVRYSLAIQRQLKDTPGVIGYSLNAHLFARRFWTLSVWQDDAALAQFVGRTPHSNAMTGLAGRMGATRFVRWTIHGSDYPIAWPAALERRTVEASAGAAG